MATSAPTSRQSHSPHQQNVLADQAGCLTQRVGAAAVAASVDHCLPVQRYLVQVAVVGLEKLFLVLSEPCWLEGPVLRRLWWRLGMGLSHAVHAELCHALGPGLWMLCRHSGVLRCPLQH